MEKVEISVEQANQILILEEDHFCDLKSKDIKPAKLTECVSSFANTSGGEIYIGIDEIDKQKKIRKWRGFDDIEEANAHIQEITRLSPLGSHFVGTFLASPDQPGYILQLQVYKTKEIIYASNGTAYIRRGAQKLPLRTQEEIDRLKLDKGIHSFEDETVNADLSVVTNSIVILKFLLDIIPTAEPEPWLNKQQLIIEEKPTVAGLLLYADEPQALLPKRSAVKIFRYKTKEEKGSRETLAFDPLTIEGAIYDLIYQTVKRTKELVEEIKRMGVKGLERISYPDETLHEIVTNAVLHRDYSITTDIQIRLFDNRIEVESPGRLPGHITVENILDEQFARNPKVVRLINKFPNPPNKDVGEGLNTAFDAMRKLRLKPPEIRETENSVLVVIRHETLASPEDAVIEYLKNNQEITNRIGRDITGIQSENTMKNVFYRLRDKGLIEQVPGKAGPASAWRMVR